jgi:PII-like signaling protein
MQYLLDDFAEGAITFDELLQSYTEHGLDSMDVLPYQGILGFGRDHARV